MFKDDESPNKRKSNVKKVGLNIGDDEFKKNYQPVVL
jgi:hypothetical protein